MPTSPYGSMYPRAGYWLSVIGGGLIALVGLAQMVTGVVLPRSFEDLLPGHTGFVLVVGAVGVAVGLGIVLLGVRLRSSPGTSRLTGTLIVVLALASYFGYGGLFLGLVLAFIGGVAAMGWRPPAVPRTMYGLPGYNAPIRQIPGGLPWEASRPPSTPPGVPPRICSSCGATNPPTATSCGQCATVLT